ncbi:acyl-CoA thioesterase [Marilutibacter penaei]|nr:thioesterase family protein [Lysobacter penaei]
MSTPEGTGPDGGDATGAAPKRSPRKKAAATPRKSPRNSSAAATDTTAAKPARAPRKRAAAREVAHRAGEKGGSPATVPDAPGADTAALPMATQPRPMVLHRSPMRVRWRDLDAFNHVNNATYLGYLEEARLEWMVGLPGMGLDDDVAPVIAAVQLNYRRPITWPATLEIELHVERLGSRSLTIGHRIQSADDPAVLFCDGHVVMVWIDRATGEATTLPASVRGACDG